MKTNFFKDPFSRNAGYWSLLVLVESIQLVIVLGLISTFIPFSNNPFNADLFPLYKSELRPNYQMQIYHLFILASILAQAAGIYFFRRKLNDNGFQEKIKALLYVEGLWVFVQCYAIFKILIYPGGNWAWYLFYGCLAASFLSRIFWVEVVRGASKAEEFLMRQSLQGRSEEATFKPGLDEFLWMPLLIIVESLQLLIAYDWLWGRSKAGGVLFLYGVFIAGIGVFSYLAKAFKVRPSKIKAFIVTEALLTFLLLSALFKIIVYDYRNQLALDAYHVLLVLALLNKIGWSAIETFVQKIYTLVTSSRRANPSWFWADYFLVGLIMAIVYLPDPEGVLAKIFVGEQFHHMNHFIMAPGWAYVKGCVLDVDVISRYGIGAPMVLSTLAKCIGGYSYLNILRVIMGICMVYYVLCYIFLRLWFKNFALAAAAILMGIKVQMFYTLTLPQPLTYASGTPVRFICDIFFMFCIWGHLSTRRWVYLWLAAASCSIAIFYMMETGLYLTAAFYGYLILHALTPALRKAMLASGRDRLKVALCALSVPMGAFLLFGLAAGRHVFTQAFWYNTVEFTQIFTNGLLTGPFYGGLQYGQFWDLLIGFLFPVVYVFTILIIGTLCVRGKISTKHLMAVVWCLYGLGAHHYYISLPTTNNYYMRGLPFVFVVFYWVRMALIGLPLALRRQMGMALLAFSSYCLWTNHHFLSYPNLFNFSRNPLVDPLVAETLPDRKPYLLHKVWDIPEDLKLTRNSLGEKDEGLKRDFTTDQELKDYYRKENDYSKDARLIQLLTGPRDPVAIISSFEIEMLMQADRKPLFYYFSLTFSRPLRMRNFGTIEIFTHGQLKKLIDQLQGAASPYVFMERIFLGRDVPKQYAHDNPALMGLLEYIKGHYRPYSYGKYLVALKRKEMDAAQ